MNLQGCHLAGCSRVVALVFVLPPGSLLPSADAAGWVTHGWPALARSDAWMVAAGSSILLGMIHCRSFGYHADDDP